ncbi:protease inhibitor I42 family protein [Thioalkalivibrio sp. XN8]|uniref:protease inhibitor I42 family protein n=1 Tax=Thioalkalivibrio sp. XN8 TaxID=2712863 RepID=UPI0013E9F63A|nr:protease inhibitor I42 family protein [Thioalkalivibrio sp. XN8]NGP54250.1 protease inhibitor I42 family protein [Thioalkalivibrio sp. XN8]
MFRRIPVLCAALLTLAACSPEQAPPPAPAPAPAAAPAAATAPAREPAMVPVPVVVLTDADDGRAVRLQRDEVVEVRLPADRGSGFTWIPAENVLPVMRTDGMPHYEAGPADGPGTETWRFVALEPGHAHLVFDYLQPLGGAAPARSVTFHFDVE